MRSSSLRFLTWVGLVNMLPHYLPLQAAASMEVNFVLSKEGVVPEATPFLVSIQKRDLEDKNNEDQPGDHLCGGALLAKGAVLTSAHCAHKLSTFEYQIVAGTHVLGGLIGRQRRLISRIVFHPHYDRRLFGKMLYNMAIILVKSPFDFNDHVYAKLPRFDDQPRGNAEFFSWGSDASRYRKERVKIREPVTVTSFLVIIIFALFSYHFGFSVPGYVSAVLFVGTTLFTATEMLKQEEIEILQYEGRHLKTETYRILSQRRCEKQIKHFQEKDDWSNNLLCTKPLPGTSVYDSGGLLVQDGVLVGIWCSTSEYNSFFLRVSAFRKWIEEQIRS